MILPLGYHSRTRLRMMLPRTYHSRARLRMMLPSTYHSRTRLRMMLPRTYHSRARLGMILPATYHLRRQESKILSGRQSWQQERPAGLTVEEFGGRLGLSHHKLIRPSATGIFSSSRPPRLLPGCGIDKGFSSLETEAEPVMILVRLLLVSPQTSVDIIAVYSSNYTRLKLLQFLIFPNSKHTNYRLPIVTTPPHL